MLFIGKGMTKDMNEFIHSLTAIHFIAVEIFHSIKPDLSGTWKSTSLKDNKKKKSEFRISFFLLSFILSSQNLGKQKNKTSLMENILCMNEPYKKRYLLNMMWLSRAHTSRKA